MTFDNHLPVIDLHRHLDGNVRLGTILDLGRQYNLPLPAWDVEGLRPYVQVTDPQPGILAFFTKFEWMTRILVDYEACRRVAYENVEDAKNEGMDYVELRFSPWFMADAHSLDPAGVVEAVCAGIAEGQRDFDLPVGLIGILSRTYGPQIAWQELQALLTQRDALRALDLAGDEIHFPGELFVEHFRTAREAGWQITAHAGEADGPRSMWQAINELGARRIGHGIRAVEDETLMDYLAEERIGIETNLTSNLQTSSVPDYASHPLRRFLEHGIATNLNTDDPGISNITLEYEFRLAAPAAGLTPEMIRQTQRNALEMAFLSPVEKQALLERKANR
jgi:adenosine deaminase